MFLNGSFSLKYALFHSLTSIYTRRERNIIRPSEMWEVHCIHVQMAKKKKQRDRRAKWRIINMKYLPWLFTVARRKLNANTCRTRRNIIFFPIPGLQNSSSLKECQDFETAQSLCFYPLSAQTIKVAAHAPKNLLSNYCNVFCLNMGRWFRSLIKM